MTSSIRAIHSPSQGYRIAAQFGDDGEDAVLKIGRRTPMMALDYPPQPLGRVITITRGSPSLLFVHRTEALAEMVPDLWPELWRLRQVPPLR
jgi:hypothetical protein